jgi:hypothetical protein
MRVTAPLLPLLRAVPESVASRFVTATVKPWFPSFSELANRFSMHCRISLSVLPAEVVVGVWAIPQRVATVASAIATAKRTSGWTVETSWDPDNLDKMYDIQEPPLHDWVVGN